MRYLVALIIAACAACGDNTPTPQPAPPVGNVSNAPILETSVDVGRRSFTKRGCNLCHSIDGSPKVGPSMKGVWARIESGQIEFEDGTRLADLLGPGKTFETPADYIREQLSRPQARVVAGFPPSEPSFEGQLRGHELESLIAYLKTL